MRRALPVLVLIVSASAANAQEPPALSAPAASASPAISLQAPSASPRIAPTPEPLEPADPSKVLDNIGRLVKNGKLKVQADLLAGSIPAIPKYAASCLTSGSRLSLWWPARCASGIPRRSGLRLAG